MPSAIELIVHIKASTSPHSFNFELDIAAGVSFIFPPLKTGPRVVHQADITNLTRVSLREHPTTSTNLVSVCLREHHTICTYQLVRRIILSKMSFACLNI